MSEAHLTRDEIVAWRDHAAGDRARIVDHLATCVACRQAAADVERNRPADAAPSRFDAAEFVDRGYRTGAQRVTHRRSARWTWALAAAAAVLIAILPVWLTQVDQPADSFRGAATIVLVSPQGAAVARETLVFEWRTPAGADVQVRLTVVDLERPAEPLIERQVLGSRYVPTAEERSGFDPDRTYHWFVEARGVTSPAATFAVR